MVTPPIPIPGVSKSLLPGGKQNIKKHIFQVVYDFCEKKNITRGLKKGSLTKDYENYSGRFPEGVQEKRKSNNDDNHGHGQEKRRPSTLC